MLTSSLVLLMNGITATCVYSEAYYPHSVTTSTCTISETSESLTITGGMGLNERFTVKQGNLYSKFDIPTERSQDGDTQLFSNSSGVLEVHPNKQYDGIHYTASHETHQIIVKATDSGSINEASVTIKNADTVIFEETVELDGSLSYAAVADLDANGSPEVYIAATSAGSGSYGSVHAWASNNGKSATAIYTPEIEQNDPLLQGYMGHDEYQVVENRFVRRWPLYKPEDSNAKPTGGTRQLQYRLVAGEAGWILKLDRTVDY